MVDIWGKPIDYKGMKKNLKKEEAEEKKQRELEESEGWYH